jgi:hypothetical protein
MRIRAICAASGRTKLVQRASAHHSGWTYTLVPDDQGILASIEIEGPVPRPALFNSSIVNTPERKVKATVSHRFDEDLLKQLRREFQLLESLLAFQYGVSNVRWAAMRYELIFESEAEREAAVIFGWQSDRRVADVIAELDAPALQGVIDYKDQYRPLAAPLSFYREGLNDYVALKFINAFFNFYFIFEGFYGGGKTKNYAVEEEMKKSADFRDAIIETLEDMKKICPDTFLRLCTEMECSDPPSPSAIIRHLVRMRGRLHHFTNSSNRVEGTPFTHEVFEPVAELARQLALGVLFTEIANINEAAGG